VQFNIAGILAKCLSCGSHEFAPLGRHPAERADRLACTDCCTEVTFDDVLAQIGRTAITSRAEASGRRAAYPPDHEQLATS
jgi:hypothetical protein